MSKEDDIHDLLASIDVKPGQKSKPKKSSTKRKEAGASTKKAATGDDLLQFLDEIERKKPSKESSQANDDKSAAGSADDKSKPVDNDAGDTTKDDKDDADNTKKDNDNPEQSSKEIPSVVDPVASITSWWSRNKGGIWSRAQETIQDAVSDAVKQARQAEAIVREEQTHFSLGGLQNRLTSVLNTIVPPISHHEQLRIHIFHDMVGYPSVDKLLYEVFDYVMDQVEGGGDLNLVIQKGEERHRAGSDFDVHRALNYARCTLEDGVKLAKANVEEIRKAKDAATETEKQESKNAAAQHNPNFRVSEVYVSIQPVVITHGEGSIEASSESLSFVTYLLDIDHNIEISTASQALPYEWAKWLDSDGQGFKEAAIDPREWVFGWVEDALNLAFGVIAQKYVTTRMGLTNNFIEGDKGIKGAGE